MPVSEWQHSIEMPLFRIACIFGPQDCSIFSSCTCNFPNVMWASMTPCVKTIYEKYLQFDYY